MLYYLLPTIIWLLYCLYWGLKQERPNPVLSLIVFVPLVALAMFRGNVGSDTFRYLSEITWKLQGVDRPFGEFEPGFELIIGALGAVTHNARAVVLIIAGVNAILFYVSLRKWGGYWLVGAAVAVPAFYFDYTMNGLRVGLALPLCVFAYIAAERGRPIGALLLLGVATSIQMTSGLLFFLLAAYRAPFRFTLKGAIAVTVALSGLVAIFSTVLTERVLVKFALYELADSPSALSGLAPLVISAALAAPLLTTSKRMLRVNLLFLALQFAFFWVAGFTYAGIRFQLICLFAQCLVVQREFTPRLYRVRTVAAWCILFFMLCSAWRMRNYTDEQGTGDSPYLPYEFFWQAQDPG
jgi:hypothetical protein